MPSLPTYRHTRAWAYVLAGALLAIAGVVITVTSLTSGGGAEASGNMYLIAFGPVVAGIALAMRGISELAGYRAYVAWRYLLVAHPKVTRADKIAIAGAFAARIVWWAVSGNGLSATIVAFSVPFTNADTMITVLTTVGMGAAVFWGVLRHSKPAMFGFLGAILMALASMGVAKLVARNALPFFELDPDQQLSALQVCGIVSLCGWAIAGLCTFFGSLRAFFTFFTTVPIGGVWIGTAALVCVLSVMSGFESDLREKILGSNAHIQVTREDGEFTDWRDVKAKIDKIPGVVASTPYAVSEVVIAAHNNGQNVIIKGIDPKTVGSVTDLISDLEDREAMSRLAPLVDDTSDRSIPQKPHTKDVVDPPPDDMPSGGEPIDFSGEGSGSAAGSAASPPVPGRMLEPPLPFPEDDAPTQSMDPPPSDLLQSDEVPRDFSGRDDDDSAISVIDIDPGVSRRTQALPGILVGRELVKQTHLYTGEEVRVVSPLSDPSNPDATGTPIPFNRDYRVAGIFYTGMYEYDLKYVYVTLDSLQDFLDRGDAVDGIEIRIDDPDDTARFVDPGGEIAKAIGPGYRVVDWKELNQSLFSALKLEKIAMFLVLGIVILVASFSIVGNLIMVVVEKAREIALLKTLGASDTGVTQLFAIQGLMIGLIGTVLGIATGLIACWTGKRFGLPLNPDVYYIDRLPIHIDPQSVAAAAAAGVLISIAATLYPAFLAARVRPAAGMRH